jgi:hypothetical protein
VFLPDLNRIWDDFLFNTQQQESLLFEDQSNTYTKTLSWALQSLRIVNVCITLLISAWDMYNKSSVLDISRDSSGESISKQYLDHIELQMRQLEEMIKDNNAKQEEI